MRLRSAQGSLALLALCLLQVPGPAQAAAAPEVAAEADPGMLESVLRLLRGHKKADGGSGATEHARRAAAGDVSYCRCTLDIMVVHDELRAVGFGASGAYQIKSDGTVTAAAAAATGANRLRALTPSGGALVPVCEVDPVWQESLPLCTRENTDGKALEVCSVCPAKCETLEGSCVASCTECRTGCHGTLFPNDPVKDQKCHCRDDRVVTWCADASKVNALRISICLKKEN
eukprot:TRINITY_DN3107_c1_g1_i1.p1 TRINITY_DN3107_c1_g1~~TRINITY_DN3107_c1_g1_i1.p1  ORF type:complete len:231 (-),score=59.98 TRINITY_DN3107_c1_g1_i1:98-790(-)